MVSRGGGGNVVFNLGLKGWIILINDLLFTATSIFSEQELLQIKMLQKKKKGWEEGGRVKGGREGRVEEIDVLGVQAFGH